MTNNTPVIMSGNAVAAAMLKDLKWDPSTTLYILSNQADQASAIYVRNKARKCAEVGIKCQIYDISALPIEEIRSILYLITLNPNKYYVIFQKPLPLHLREYEAELDQFFIKQPGTDIDAFKGDLSTEFKTPATPLGVMKLLDYYIGIKNLDGKHAVVIGRSDIVGKPIAQLLLRANCTVTICHSHTTDLKQITRQADIIVSAIGKPKFITAEYISPEKKPIIVDVGINRTEDGKVCGDIDFDSVAPLSSYITPVPGGVGVLTVASLIYKAAERSL